MFDIFSERLAFINHALCLRHSLAGNASQVKGKAVPQHTYGGTGGERMYSSYSFTTLTLDGDEWSASCAGRALPPGKGPPVPIGQEAGWGLNFDCPVVQPAVRHYTD
jgi:hypothetical protein